MVVSRKRKRSIVVDAREYLWWVGDHSDDVRRQLNIVTPDGRHGAVHTLPIVQHEELFPGPAPEVITPSIVATLIRHRPRGEPGPELRFDTVALGLEGTLVSNAFSQIPRAGLLPLLDGCRRHIPRLVVFTAASDAAFRAVAKALVGDGRAPAWFVDVECVPESEAVVSVPGCDPGRVLVVDHRAERLAADQVERWIQVPEFVPPYAEDRALHDVWAWIKIRNGKTYEWR